MEEKSEEKVTKQRKLYAVAVDFTAQTVFQKQRFQLFTEYNNMTNNVQQINNILSNIEVLDIERQRLCIEGQRLKTRDVSIQYFFRREGVRTRVCN